MVCSGPCKLEDLIDLQEGKTAFSNHNSVEAKKYGASFIC